MLDARTTLAEDEQFIGRKVPCILRDAAGCSVRVRSSVATNVQRRVADSIVISMVPRCPIKYGCYVTP